MVSREMITTAEALESYIGKGSFGVRNVQTHCTLLIFFPCPIALHAMLLHAMFGSKLLIHLGRPLLLCLIDSGLCQQMEMAANISVQDCLHNFYVLNHGTLT
jgi:hypothetical protein